VRGAGAGVGAVARVGAAPARGGGRGGAWAGRRVRARRVRARRRGRPPPRRCGRFGPKPALLPQNPGPVLDYPSHFRSTHHTPLGAARKPVPNRPPAPRAPNRPNPPAPPPRAPRSRTARWPRPDPTCDAPVTALDRVRNVSGDLGRKPALAPQNPGPVLDYPSHFRSTHHTPLGAGRKPVPNRPPAPTRPPQRWTA